MRRQQWPVLVIDIPLMIAAAQVQIWTNHISFQSTMASFGNRHSTYDCGGPSTNMDESHFFPISSMVSMICTNPSYGNPFLRTTKTKIMLTLLPTGNSFFSTNRNHNNVLAPPLPSLHLDKNEIKLGASISTQRESMRGSSNSSRRNVLKRILRSSSFLFSFFWPFRNNKTKVNEQSTTNTSSSGINLNDKKIRIGIIGGGIAGISVAHALTERLLLTESDDAKGRAQYEIVVFEGSDDGASSSNQQWEAATARNANTLAVAASMHIFSTTDTLWQVAKDTCREWYEIFKEKVSNEPIESCPKKLFQKRSPPYFALHPWACLGPHATHDESMAFIRFSIEFIKAALFSGNEATKVREHLHCQLAQANRAMYLNEMKKDKSLKERIGHSKGFLAAYRSLEAAKQNKNDALMHGEEASIMEWKDAELTEPHLTNVHLKAECELSKPISLFVVRRPNDYTANCEEFVKHWTNEIQKRGVIVEHNKKVKQIKKTKHRTRTETGRRDTITNTKSENKRKKKYFQNVDSTQYQVILQDKEKNIEPQKESFDIVVLACGINTPLVAASLGIGHLCPTYPLRGFSLTVNVQNDKQKEDHNKYGSNNLLRQPFSLDNIYCSSVGPNMARLAGFGEFVGFRSDYTESISSIGPSVLHRYAHMYFPLLEHNGHKHVAKSCFRPLSPDDLPLIGSVKGAPGVFLHTGHGTFGWTTGLATGDCVAQDIAEYLINKKDKKRRTKKVDKNDKSDHTVMEGTTSEKTTNFKTLYYDLADGSRILKSSVSPNRFA